MKAYTDTKNYTHYLWQFYNTTAYNCKHQNLLANFQLQRESRERERESSGGRRETDRHRFKDRWRLRRRHAEAQERKKDRIFPNSSPNCLGPEAIHNFDSVTVENKEPPEPTYMFRDHKM